MTRTPRWAAFRLLSGLKQRFLRGWRRGAPAARRRWFAGVGLGFLVLLAVVVGTVEVGRHLETNGVLAWEDALLRRLAAESPVSFSTAVWIQTLGTDITLVMVVFFTAGLAAWTARPLRALTIVASIALLDPVVRMAWTLWNRARPAVILDGAAAPGFASFPSGHTAKSVALYGVLTFLWAHASDSRTERALAALLFLAVAGLVMFGRLRMGVHWPSDVVAGAVVGGVWALALITALEATHRADRAT